MSGMTDPQPRFVYVDANPFIYLIESDDSLAASVRDLFAMFQARPGLAVTSELTLAEVLPKAAMLFRRAYFDLIVWSGAFDLRPIRRQILVETADYRRKSATTMVDGRKTMPKIPDAIHVVTAARSGCRWIISADGAMKVPSGFRLIDPNDA